MIGIQRINNSFNSFFFLNNNNILISLIKMDPSISKTISEFNKKVVEVTTSNIKYKPVKADDELTRLLNDKFYNPYDVLQLHS
jgi:hypothetical protein